MAKDGFFLASGLSFEILLSCIPFFFLLVSALGFLLAGSDRALAAVQAVLQQLLPASHLTFAEALPVIAARRELLGFTGVVLLFFFGSGTLGSIRNVLNVIFEAPRQRNIFFAKGMDLLMMLTVSGLFIMSIVIGALIAFLRGVSDHVPIIGAWLQSGGTLAMSAAGFLLTFLLFFLLYRFCPARTLGRSSLIFSSLLGAILFELSKQVFSLYVSMAHTYTALFGAMSGLFFFFLWVYYASLVFILSAIIGRALDQEPPASSDFHTTA
ncbi:MAG TPA: YihY/virulence factor BrkB family protein [Nitrospiria bacterium]